MRESSRAVRPRERSPMRPAIIFPPPAALMVPGSGSARASSTPLVVNEIDYDQPGTDDAEFVEIKNVSGASVSLAGHSLSLVNGTGGGASVYQTIDLPGTSLGPGDHFVVCANPAATANCDLDVTPETNLIQNGAPDAVAIVLGGTVVDSVSYEGDTGAPYTEGSGAGLLDDPADVAQGISRLPDGTDTDQNNADLDSSCITAGAVNTSTATACRPPVVARIRDIQGATHFSPLDDTPVADVPGVVTAVSGIGFWFQDPAHDSNEATSEGIFVFTGSAPGVAPGDTVIGTGGRLPPTEVIDDDATGDVNTSGTFDPATDGIDFYESLEGMRVRVNDAVAVGPRNQFGETPVVGDGSSFAGVDTVRDGVVIRPDDFNPERIILDDTLMATPAVNEGDGFTTAAIGV